MMSEFLKTEEIVQELNTCDQMSFPLLYAFKVENENSQAELA